MNHSEASPSKMKISARTFEIPTAHNSMITVQIYDDVNIRADNLHLETWGSSLVLSRRLHAIQIPNLSPSRDTSAHHTTPKTSERCGPILELGAGTGLVGISAAAIWEADVILTDLSPIVPALEKNIDLNRNLLSSSGGSALSAALDWKNPSILTVHPQKGDVQASRSAESVAEKASVILAADTIYDSSHPEMLINVIKEWLKRGPDSRVLIAYPVRVAYLEEIRELWERLELIGLEAVEEGKEELPKKEWDDETLIEWSVWKWK